MNAAQGAAKRRRTIGGTVFEWFMLLAAVVLFVFPFVNLTAVSFSSPRAILSGEVFLWPVEFNTDAWYLVFRNRELISSFSFTVLLTLGYTALALLLVMFAAYPLSKRDLKGRVPMLGFLMFTMYFSGGIIPSYLLYQSLHLLDTFWVLVLPGAFSVYNFLILKSFFQGIPPSLEESARIDGANEWQILFRIYIPMSLPILATLALFFAVGRWNGFSDALYFIPTHKEYDPLQLILQRVLQRASDRQQELIRMNGLKATVHIVKESQRAAIILFTVIPIILVYPWLQRFFVKGVMIGSVKG